MDKTAVYLLVHDEPFALGEILGMLKRQDQTDFTLIGITPPGLSKASQKLCEKNFAVTGVMQDDDAGSAIMKIVKERDEQIIILLDSTSMPSNQVWLRRLRDHIGRENADVVIGRIVSDCYTNWLIQNEIGRDQHIAMTKPISAFYFQFANFAVTKQTLQKKPFPSGTVRDFAMKWALDTKPAVLFSADATVTHLMAIEPEDYMAAYSRYSRASSSFIGRIGMAITAPVKGFFCDVAFSLGRRMPQWIFYSIYMRIRQGFAILF